MSQPQMKQCPNCTKLVPKDARTCPECGDTIVHSSFAGFVIIILAPFLIAFGLFEDNADSAIMIMYAVIIVAWLVRRAIKNRETAAD